VHATSSNSQKTISNTLTVGHAMDYNLVVIETQSQSCAFPPQSLS
jgi:hypothetical protein